MCVHVCACVCACVCVFAFIHAVVHVLLPPPFLSHSLALQCTTGVGAQQSLDIFSTATGDRLHTIEGAHSGGSGGITSVHYDADSEHILSVAHTRVHVWRALAHKQELLRVLQVRLRAEKHATARERIAQQVKQVQAEIARGKQLAGL